MSECLPAILNCVIKPPGLLIRVIRRVENEKSFLCIGLNSKLHNMQSNLAKPKSSA